MTFRTMELTVFEVCLGTIAEHKLETKNAESEAGAI